MDVAEYFKETPQSE
jgi:hypothetical protein